MLGKVLARDKRVLRGVPTGLVRREGVRGGARVAVLAALAVSFSGQSLEASEPTIASGPMIQRSMRLVPRRYVITPSGATVAANQTQQFGVVDTNGKAVAVRWNLSGLGCYGASCGSIDDQGVYHPPATLPKPAIVTLEGVVVSDPHYSVLTQIRLQPAKSEPNLTETAAAPAVASDRAARSSDLPPVPVAVAAAPKVASIETTRSANPIPLPSVVVAPPQVPQQKSSSRLAAMPLPGAVNSPPSVSAVSGKESRTKEMPLELAIGAAPAVGNQKDIRSKALLPLPSAAGNGQSTASSSGALHAQPAAAAATVAPLATNSGTAQPVPARAVTTQPSSSAGPVGPSAAGSSTKPQPTAALVTMAAPPANAGNRPALPLANDPAKETAESKLQQVSLRVTYRDGLLTIDARNATLADVLKAVATKTGATIDVPPGTGQEPIVEHAGPGKLNDVMTQLLNGSHFNFILVNSPQHPEELSEVLLSVQPADSGTVVAQTPAPAPALVPNPSTPPAAAAAIQPRPLDYDLTQVPTDMSRDAMGDFMKERFRQILERQKQETPQQ